LQISRKGLLLSRGEKMKRIITIIVILLVLGCNLNTSPSPRVETLKELSNALDLKLLGFWINSDGKTMEFTKSNDLYICDNIVALSKIQADLKVFYYTDNKTTKDLFLFRIIRITDTELEVVWKDKTTPNIYYRN